MPKGKRITDPNQLSKDNLRWIDDMDLVLLNALIEEAMKGNRHDGSWTTKAYANVIKVLSATISPYITKQYIKNRMKALKILLLRHMTYLTICVDFCGIL